MIFGELILFKFQNINSKYTEYVVLKKNKQTNIWHQGTRRVSDNATYLVGTQTGEDGEGGGSGQGPVLLYI